MARSSKNYFEVSLSHEALQLPSDHLRAQLKLYEMGKGKSKASKSSGSSESISKFSS